MPMFHMKHFIWARYNANGLYLFYLFTHTISPRGIYYFHHHHIIIIIIINFLDDDIGFGEERMTG